MKEEFLWYIFINVSLINNFVLVYFLGICFFLGVLGKFEMVMKMGGVVIFVMLISFVCVYGINVFLIVVGVLFL